MVLRQFSQLKGLLLVLIIRILTSLEGNDSMLGRGNHPHTESTEYCKKIHFSFSITWQCTSNVQVFQTILVNVYKLYKTILWQCSCKKPKLQTRVQLFKDFTSNEALIHIIATIANIISIMHTIQQQWEKRLY